MFLHSTYLLVYALKVAGRMVHVRRRPANDAAQQAAPVLILSDSNLQIGLVAHITEICC